MTLAWDRQHMAAALCGAEDLDVAYLALGGGGAWFEHPLGFGIV